MIYTLGVTTLQLMKNSFCLLIVLFLLCGVVPVCHSQADLEVYAFGDGELLEFTVSYNWGWLWIDAGSVDFRASKLPDNEVASWYFLSTGRSFRKFDWFFKVRDTFEVTTTANLRPIQFRRHCFEGSHITFNDYHFHPHKSEVRMFTTDTEKDAFYGTVPLPPETTDVLTATYLTRSLNFEHLTIGDTLYISTIMDDAAFRLPIVFHGREVVETRAKKKFKAIKFSAELEKGSLFKEGEKIYVWITDDANRLPLMIEARIIVGSIKVHLTGFEYPAHPVNSLISEQ